MKTSLQALLQAIAQAHNQQETSHQDDPAFNTDNLTDLNAPCLHYCTRLAALRSNTTV